MAMDFEKTLQEKLRAPMKTRELERRWKAARKVMKEHDIDLLIMQNENQWSVCYFRYFTDVPAECNTPMTLLFPLDDESTIISSGGKPTPLLPAAWALRGIKDRINLPYFRGVNHTHEYDAGAAVEYIKKRGSKRVGVVGLGEMSAAFYMYIVNHLPEVELIDISDEIDQIIAVKSEDEIQFIRKAAYLQDLLCDAMPTIIRPGRYEYEVRNEIVHVLEDLGSEEQFILLSSGPSNTPVGPANMFFQNKRIERGDTVYVMIEANGPGGYWTEIARTWTLGEPSRELVEAYDHSYRVQKILAEALAHESDAETYMKLGNVYLSEHGFPTEERLIGHGQGYNCMERPVLHPREKLKVSANMNIALHPSVLTDKAFAFACDNYLTTNGAAERLHKTEQKVFIIEH